MSDVDDLVTWLRQQLDDDERVARKAGSRALAWPVNGTWHLEGVEHDVVGEEEAFCHPHNVAHIARHDPARTLAEVDAKRRILELHDQGGQRWVGFPRADRQENYCVHDQLTAPCPTVRLLALPYADRAGYRDQWRP